MDYSLVLLAGLMAAVAINLLYDIKIAQVLRRAQGPFRNTFRLALIGSVATGISNAAYFASRFIYLSNRGSFASLTATADTVMLINLLAINVLAILCVRMLMGTKHDVFRRYIWSMK
jgi:hypothetical protein